MQINCNCTHETGRSGQWCSACLFSCMSVVSFNVILRFWFRFSLSFGFFVHFCMFLLPRASLFVYG